MSRLNKLEIPVMAGSIGITFILWYVMFIRPPDNFWILMCISIVALSIISLLLRFPPVERGELTWKQIRTGIIAAVVLYLIFMSGNRISEFIIPDKENQLGIIYDKGQLLPRPLIAVLLFFPIGFGEELFWRGLVQRVASAKWGWKNGFLFTLVFYTAVHIATLNIMLIGAAFVCGLFWGLLYWRTNSLVPCLISHMIWDPLIMIILPIR